MAKKSKLKIGLPANSEDFRKRIRILSNAMGMVRLKMSNHSWLLTCSKQAWEDHTEFILGPKVLGQTAKDDMGNQIFSAPWHLILSYEFSIREKAAFFVNEERYDLAKALLEARKDHETRTDCFTTPMAISITSQGRRQHTAPPQQEPPRKVDPIKQQVPQGGSFPTKRERKAAAQAHRKAAATASGKQLAPPPPAKKHKAGGGSGKGDGKGKAGGKNKRGDYNTTPDGKQICFKFNNREACDGSCGRVHVCQRCLDTGHGVVDCRVPPYV